MANLPYSVATPLIANLLASPIVPQSMTVTVQKEVAERIVARPPARKDYGALSVWIQSQCRVELVRVLPPSVFWPRPQVSSAILHIEIDRNFAAESPIWPFFTTSRGHFSFIGASFCAACCRAALKGRSTSRRWTTCWHKPT